MIRLKTFFASLLSLGCSAKAPADDASAASAPARSTDPHQWVADGALLLDVRTPAEFSIARLKGAVNIPIQVLASRMGEITADTVVVYCASGNRSQTATRLLEAQGKAVLDIKSMRGWGRPEDIEH